MPVATVRVSDFGVNWDHRGRGNFVESSTLLMVLHFLKTIIGVGMVFKDGVVDNSSSQDLDNRL
jgi:hypothetical protein